MLGKAWLALISQRYDIYDLEDQKAGMHDGQGFLAHGSFGWSFCWLQGVGGLHTFKSGHHKEVPNIS